MRGQRDKQALEAAKAAGNAIQIIDVSKHKPRRIPSAKWRELIKKVWEADPLMCPRCSHEMRIVSLIDDRAVIEQILRHLGLWEEGVRVHSGADPPTATVVEPWLSLPAVADRRRRDDPFPDYDTEPVLFANG